MKEMFRWMMWIVVAGSLAVGGGYHSCYEYQADDFVLTPPLPYERIVLVVPRDWKRPNETHPLVLLLTDRSGRKERMSQYLLCDHNTTRGRYRCGGECDGGEVFVGEDMSLNLDTPYKLDLDIPTVGKYEEEKRTELNLRKGLSSAQGREVPCPLYTERLYNPERLGDKPDEPLLNVCYTRKTTTKGHLRYHGCFMTTARCNAVHREHFGYYPSIDRAYAGFLRCVDSNPN